MVLNDRRTGNGRWSEMTERKPEPDIGLKRQVVTVRSRMCEVGGWVYFDAGL